MKVFLFFCMCLRAKDWVPNNERLIEYYTNAKKKKKAENLTIHQSDEKLLTDTQWFQ